VLYSPSVLKGLNPGCRNKFFSFYFWFD